MRHELNPQILILGSERSGTNLLRAILSTHSKIASPPPAGFVSVIGRARPNYFPVGRSPYLSELIDDVILQTRIHLNPWDIELDPEEVMAQLKEASLWEVFRVVNMIYAREHGRICWCSKEPDLFEYISEIAEHLPGAKFIYLVRDGRDVAASMLRGHRHEFHVYFAAKSWSRTQRLCLGALESPIVGGRIHIVKYENLIANTEDVMRNLMEFIGLEFEEAQLHYYRNQDVLTHSRKSKFWKNLAQPINEKNKGAYKDKLGAKNIEIFESVAWDEMAALGYQVESKHRMEISDFAVRIYRAIRDLKKQIWSLDPRYEARQSRVRVKIAQQIINKNR